MLNNYRHGLHIDAEPFLVKRTIIYSGHTLPGFNEFIKEWSSKYWGEINNFLTKVYNYILHTLVLKREACQICDDQ
jgi:hypothetical protein